MTPDFGAWLDRELRRRHIDGAAGLERASGGTITYATGYNWLSGRTRPKAEQLRTLESVGINYIDALVAAGVVNQDDLDGYVAKPEPPTDMSRRELLQQLWRMEEGESDDAS